MHRKKQYNKNHGLFGFRGRNGKEREAIVAERAHILQADNTTTDGKRTHLAETGGEPYQWSSEWTNKSGLGPCAQLPISTYRGCI